MGVGQDDEHSATLQRTSAGDSKMQQAFTYLTKHPFHTMNE